MVTKALCGIAVLGGLVWVGSAANAADLPVPPVTILTNIQDYDPVRFEAAYMIAEAWRELGLTVEVEALPFPELIDRVQHHQDFDAAVMGWSGRADRFDPQFFLGLLDSHQSDLRGNNFTGYDNPEYDALFHAQSQAFDPEARRGLVHAAQEIAARDVPIAVLTYRDTVVGHSLTSFTDLVTVPSDGFYSEWTMMSARPLTERTRVRIGGHQSPDNFNPVASTTSWGWRWMRLYYDFLVRLTPGSEPQLWAAEKVDVIGDATLEVTLREGLKFHDGAPVTAEDVAFSFTYLQDSDFAYFDAYLAGLQEVRVVDPLTVRFTLDEPSASFISNALSQVAILPRHIWQDIENPSGLAPEAVPVVGSGPFRFTSHDPGWSMSLDTFADHFAAYDIHVSGIDFLFYYDNMAVVAALLAGEIDITGGIVDPWLAPSVEEAEGVGLMAAHDIGFNNLSYNTRRHAFNDAGFRRALTHAIDLDRIVEVLIEGRAVVGHGIIAPVNTFWHNPDLDHPRFDMDAARDQLIAAGFGWGADGRLLMPAALAR